MPGIIISNQSIFVLSQNRRKSTLALPLGTGHCRLVMQIHQWKYESFFLLSNILSHIPFFSFHQANVIKATGNNWHHFCKPRAFILQWLEIQTMKTLSSLPTYQVKELSSLYATIKLYRYACSYNNRLYIKWILLKYALLIAYILYITELTEIMAFYVKSNDAAADWHFTNFDLVANEK